MIAFKFAFNKSNGQPTSITGSVPGQSLQANTQLHFTNNTFSGLASNPTANTSLQIVSPSTNPLQPAVNAAASTELRIETSIARTFATEMSATSACKIVMSDLTNYTGRPPIKVEKEKKPKKKDESTQEEPVTEEPVSSGLTVLSFSGSVEATSSQDVAGGVDVYGNGVVWLKDWSSAYVYYKNEMVRDGAWTMIANKETTERPAPARIGEPYWVSGFDDNPPWPDSGSTTSNTVLTGQRYTWGPSEGYVDAVRCYLTDTTGNVEYSLVLVIDPLGSPVWRVFFDDLSPTQAGWLTIPTEPIFVSSGSVVDLILVAAPSESAPESTFSGEWRYRTGGGNPSAGEIRQSGETMLVHYTDNNTGDRETEVRTLTPGSVVSVHEISWEIIDITFGAEYATATVIPATTITQTVYTFTFNVLGAGLLPYVADNDHYSANANVEGLYSETGYDAAILDQNAYGVDIEVQAANISADWDVVAVSESSGGGGGGGDASLGTDNTWTGVNIYTNPISGVDPIAPADLTTKQYVDNHFATTTTESFTLNDGQTTVPFTVDTDIGAIHLNGIDIDDTRLIHTTDYTVNPDKSIVLASSYPAGTTITARVNDTSTGGQAHTHSNKAILDATTASFLAEEKTKLTGIEIGATADQTDAEIKTAYENNADTNAFTDAEQTKLAGLGQPKTYQVISVDTAVSSGEAYAVDVSAAVVTVTLPATPADGDSVSLIDHTGNAATNNITVARNGKTISALDEDLLIDVDRTSIVLRFNTSLNDWFITEGTGF